MSRLMRQYGWDAKLTDLLSVLHLQPREHKRPLAVRPLGPGPPQWTAKGASGVKFHGAIEMTCAFITVRYASGWKERCGDGHHGSVALWLRCWGSTHPLLRVQCTPRHHRLAGRPLLGAANEGGQDRRGVGRGHARRGLTGACGARPATSPRAGKPPWPPVSPCSRGGSSWTVRGLTLCPREHKHPCEVLPSSPPKSHPPVPPVRQDPCEGSPKAHVQV
jgi:hypothetical protein